MIYTIYGKPGCSFCVKAKNLLEVKGFDYDYKELGTDFLVEDLLARNPAAKTFPQIFVDDRLVGGYVDLEDEID